MWELNFEDINKLHMSMGAGLMLASIVLLISTFWTAYDKRDKLTLDIYEKEINLTKYPYYYEIRISQLKIINYITYLVYFLSILLMISGGYFYKFNGEGQQFKP